MLFRSAATRTDWIVVCASVPECHPELVATSQRELGGYRTEEQDQTDHHDDIPQCRTVQHGECRNDAKDANGIQSDESLAGPHGRLIPRRVSSHARLAERLHA
jgi:hypothetical protein